MSKESRFTKWNSYSCQLTVKDIEGVIISASAYGERINGEDIKNAFMTADSWIEFFLNGGNKTVRTSFIK